jgi:tetratricopeptide (TPR) repeat protein
VAGRSKEAIQDFSRVIELNPDYANAWHNRAEIYFDSGEYAKAIRDYTESLNRDPENRTALLKRGQSKLKLGKARAALDDFDQLIKLDEQQASVYVERGEAKRALGEWEGSASDFRKAIQLDQKLAYAYQRAAWLMATCPEERIRNASLAVQAARQAIELGEQTDFRNHDVLAAALANDGKFVEARAEVQRAIDAAPEEARENLKVRQELYQREMPYREKVQTLAAK